MNGPKPDPEDPFEYVENNLINARESANEAEKAIDVGPTQHTTEEAHHDVMDAVGELESVIDRLDHAGTVLKDAEELASGADEAYEDILETRDFINHAEAGLDHIEQQQSIPAGEMTVAGVDYEIHLTPIEGDEDDE